MANRTDRKILIVTGEWMRALFFDNRLKLIDFPKPLRKKNQALIKVHMAGICNTDLEIYKGYKGFKGIPGHEFVGRVECCDNEKLMYKRVVGEINYGCGECYYCKKGLKSHCKERRVLGILNHHGAFAEYLVLPEENLHIVPDGISDEEAVFVEPLAACFQIIEQLHIKPTERVIVLGDGKLGLLAAQVLDLAGCDILLVGKHSSHLSLIQKRGIKTSLADDIYDMKADVVVECTGSPKGFEMALGLTRPKGKIVLKSTLAEKREIDITSLVIDEITVIGSRCGPFLPAIRALEKKLIDVKPLIHETYSIIDGVKAFEKAAQKGVLKVLLSMGESLNQII